MKSPWLTAIHTGLALLLLTPLVWAPGTFYPFSVGKAVYARSLIAVVFALWALLALARPQWPPPPGAILCALAAGLLVAALSAWTGVSAQRSLWSTYTRMGGLVDHAHWFAFALVLTATVRNAGDWHRLFNAGLCVGLVAALVAIARAYAPELAIPGLPPEARPHRISATTDNPTFLGAYMQVTALLAAGFLARSWTRAPAPATGYGIGDRTRALR